MSVIAVCQDGEFEIISTATGPQINCTGTLINKIPSTSIVELSQADVAELGTAILTFFSICFVVKFFRRFIETSSPGRGA